jgi:hypothetical protein
MTVETDATKTTMVRLFRAYLDDLIEEAVRAVTAEQRRHLQEQAAKDARIAELEMQLAVQQEAA